MQKYDKITTIMDIKDNLAKNLIKYRKALNLTQIELADKINYSDKAVSKWERGEAVPDIVVLKQLALFYGTTIDELLDEPKEEKPKIKRFVKGKRLIVSLLAFAIVWLIAILTFSVLRIVMPNIDHLWLIFIYAIPTSTIVFIVFSAIWGKNLITAICISVLIWSIVLSIFLSLTSFLKYTPDNLWLIFIVGIPAQILCILCTTYIKLNFLSKIINKKQK